MLHEDSSSSADGRNGGIDIRRVSEAEAKMRDSTAVSLLLSAAFQHEHITSAWRLGLDEIARPVHDSHAKDATIEAESARRVLDRQGQVGQAVRGNGTGRTSHVQTG